MSLTAQQGVACGREFIDAAERHANSLPPAQRYMLYRSCNQRRSIYDVASLADDVRRKAARRPSAFRIGLPANLCLRNDNEPAARPVRCRYSVT